MIERDHTNYKFHLHCQSQPAFEKTELIPENKFTGHLDGIKSRIILH